MKRLVRFLFARYPALAELRRFRWRKIVRFRGNTRKNAKWALLSYLPDAINLRDSNRRMEFHTNAWECREMAKVLVRLGYNVECMSHNDLLTIPKRQYDLVVDLANNLQRLAPFQKSDTRFVTYLTGSYVQFGIDAERRRVSEFEARHGVLYGLRYAVWSPARMDKSMSISDLCALLGNEFVLSTYPKWARDKIRLIPVTASPVPFKKEYRQRNNRFLYFYSARNVAKGLDLVLDAFEKHPEWHLDVVGGNIDPEFRLAYPNLYNTTNVTIYPFLSPSSKLFGEILDRCDAFVAPSCTEGTSTAVVTLLSSGLFPILSRQTGTDVPAGCCVWLDDLSPEGIERGIRDFMAIPWLEVPVRADQVQTLIRHRHSRAAYSAAMQAFFTEAIT